MNKKITIMLLVPILLLSIFPSIFVLPVRSLDGALDEILVEPTGSVYNSSIVLENGVDYIIEASGAYKDEPNVGSFTDAQYYTKDNWATWHMNDVPGFEGLTTGGLFIEGWPIDYKPWGEYNSEHVYTYVYEGTGENIGFWIYDSWTPGGPAGENGVYDNDSGILTVKIYLDDRNDDLVGYWTFDEGSGSTAYDSSEFGNDGIIHSATWTEGIVGNALQFNGVNSWVQILNDPSLSGLSGITLEAWIKEDVVSANVKGIISKCTGVAHPTYNAEYYLGLYGDDLAFHSSNYNYIAHDTIVDGINEANTWYYVVSTWEGDSYSMYIDGVPLTSGSCVPQSMYSNSIDVQIGRHGTYSWTYFQGIIDEVKIYNYARTSEQILADYELSKPGDPLPDLSLTFNGLTKTNVSEGEQLGIEVTVSNIGDKIANDVLVSLVQSAEFDFPIVSPEKNVLLSWNFGDIQPGDSLTYILNWYGAEVLNIDNEAVIVIVDPKNQIQESDEENNIVVAIPNTLTVVDYEFGFDSHVDGFSFENWDMSENEQLELIAEIEAELNSYVHYGGPIMNFLINQIYSHYADGGHCYGLAAVSSLYYTGDLAKPVLENTFDMSIQDVASDIVDYQINQFITNLIDQSTTMNLTSEYVKIKNSLSSDPQTPVNMRIRKLDQSGAHAITVINTYNLTDNKINIVLYDPNFPGMSVICTFDLEQNQLLWDKNCPHYIYDNAFVYNPLEQHTSNAIKKIVQDFFVDLMKNGKKILSFKCPIDIDIVDQYGRVISSKEGILNEIPDALVEIDENNALKTFYLPMDLTYDIIIDSYGTGGVEASMMVPWMTGATISELYFDVSPDSMAYGVIYPETMELTIDLDSNGDGIIDSTINSEVAIVEEDKIPPTISIQNPDSYGLYAASTTEEFLFTITDNLDSNPEVSAIMTDLTGNDFVINSGDPLPTQTGVYTLRIEATDFYDNTAVEEITFVVYDPDAGFVTGGGWITSPEGAYKADESLTGKATFGFVSKYKKGATVPDGNTEFIFQTADLKFSSTSYDWLVIAGTKAMFKGYGTINGEGNYQFILTAEDNGKTGDTFRIKITEIGGGIVYDNGLQTELEQGSIIVHTK